MLSDYSKLKDRKIRNRKKTAVGKWYSDNQKLEAAKLWMVTGNLVHVAAALNLPYKTIEKWRYSEWWKDIVSELKTEENLQLSSKLKTIAQKSLSQMEDRVNNGDYILDRNTGEVVRKPVSLRDLTQTFNSVHDRAVRVENGPANQKEELVVDRLQALAHKFEEIANKKQPLQVTDVVFAEEAPKETVHQAAGKNYWNADKYKGFGDAIHDQRKEGLQEGTELGAQEEAQPG
jgi:hypothetical protein